MTAVLSSSPLAPQQTEATDFLLQHWTLILDNIDASTLTRRKYKTDASAFIAYIEKEGLALNTFRAYKDALDRQQSISVKTKNLKLIAAKRLLSELYHRYRLTKVDLSAGVKLFKVSNEHTKDGLSQTEVDQVKQVIDNITDDKKRLRMTAIFYLLTFQGLRQHEVSAIAFDDLRLSDQVIYVRGKGMDGKERIDLHPTTVSAISAYISYTGIRSGYLFSNTATGQPITTRQLRKLFTDTQYGLFVKAGIPSTRSLHGFRHYFVTRFLEVTSGDVLTVQQFSRHKSLQALKMYDDRKKKKQMLPIYYNAFN
jgi:integrase